MQQTIEMFEVIANRQPNDCQSLEILKEAYTKMGREQEVINTSKRIAQATCSRAAFIGDFGIRDGFTTASGRC